MISRNVLLVLCVISLFEGEGLYGQAFTVSAEFDRKFVEILRLHEADHKLAAEEMARLKREISDLKVTSCAMAEMVNFAVDNNRRYGTPVSQSLDDRLRDYRNMVEAIANDLGTRLRTSDDRTRAEFLRSAKQLAATGKTLAEIKEDAIPKLLASIKANREDFSDQVGLIRLAVSEYSATLEQLCEAVGDQTRRNDEQDRQIQELRRRVPYENGDQQPTLAPPLHQQNQKQPVPSLAQQRYTPNEIVEEGMPVCKRALVQAHYDFYAYSTVNGVQTLLRYHGNLYTTCHGKLVLVRH